MRKNTFFLFILTIVLCFWLGTLAKAQNVLWVTSKGAKLKAENKASSNTITQLAIGTKLDVTSSIGKWYQVSTASGVKGWIYQGKVSAAGIFLTGKRPEESGKGLILSAMVETYAVLGLLATFLLLNGIQVG